MAMKNSYLWALCGCLLLSMPSGKAGVHTSIAPSEQNGTEIVFRSTSGMLNNQTSLPSAAWDGVCVAEDYLYPPAPRKGIAMYNDNDPGETEEEGGGDIDDNVSDLSEVGSSLPIGDVPWGWMLVLSGVVIVHQWRKTKRHISHHV